MNQKPLYLDVHVLQTVPPSCINRDDTGSPKTARFGGSRRARVSSQAWKKAIRDDFALVLDEDKVGQRTKHAVDLIAEYIVERMPEAASDAASIAEAVLRATGIKVKDGLTGYLLFVSPLQADALAELAVDAAAHGAKVAAKDAKAILNPMERPKLNAVDVALFGRMVADAPNLNVDATVQVAHAIGVGISDPEFDYFTAMDDRSPEDTAGAGMIGTVEYLSATLYRYATLDVRNLYGNLGSVAVAKEAIGAFLKAFVTSMPTGKQNTFANRTLPVAVVIQLRDTQPVSLVGAFERPVYATEDMSVSEVACTRLVEQARAIDDAFGTTPRATYIVCGNPGARELLAELRAEDLTLGDAVSRVENEAAAYLAGCGFVDEG